MLKTLLCSQELLAQRENKTLIIPHRALCTWNPRTQRLRWDCAEFEASLGYTEKLCVKSVKQKRQLTISDCVLVVLLLLGQKYHNRKQLTGEFILAYSSRGSVHSQGAGGRGQMRKLRDHISICTQETERTSWKQEEAVNFPSLLPPPLPQWCTSQRFPNLPIQCCKPGTKYSTMGAYGGRFLSKFLQPLMKIQKSFHSTTLQSFNNFFCEYLCIQGNISPKHLYRQSCQIK